MLLLQFMTNKKSVFIMLMLILTLFAAGTALADKISDPVKISMELSNNRFSGPGPVTVSVTLSNMGDRDLPGPITLYYPDRKRVDEFGAPTLAVGSSRSWTGTWNVTQKELDNGKLTFSCKYSVYNDAGELVNKVKYFSKKIVLAGADPVIEVRRTVVPSIATKGQEVSVTYEVTNAGMVDVTNVTIKENASISIKSGTIDKVAVGETERYVFTTTMAGKDLTSSATVSYKAGGKRYITKVESAKVKYGEVKLSAALAADKKGGTPGDTVKLTLTMKNSGTVDFSNVTVTDAALGTVFSKETVPAGKTVTLTKELTITETVDLLFTVSAEDETGGKVETATGRVNLICMDPTQQVMLALEASADRNVVYRIPETVRFTIKVQNNSAVEVKNITVKAMDTTVYTIDTLAAGASRKIVRDMDISMAGTFQFTASCKDALGQTQQFTSNTVQVSYAAPTPVLAETPIVTRLVPEMISSPEEREQKETGDSHKEALSEVQYFKVGDNIFKGEYILLTTSDLPGYFAITSDAEGKNIILNENFYHNSIVTIRDGEYLTLMRCKAIRAEEFYRTEKVDINSDNAMLKVGCDLTPGSIRLKATGNSTGYYSIWLDSRREAVTESKVFDNEVEITVQEGQYLLLKHCRIQ